MSVRDSILPAIDAAQAVIASLGLQRFAVTLRRRSWSGTRIGDGTPTNQDIVLSPTPTVEFKSPFREQMTGIMTSGGTIRDRYYQISDITPQYTKLDGSIGGYTPAQLRLEVPSELSNVEAVVVLVGDDGVARECKQVIFEDSDPFGYSMVVQEVENPTVTLDSIAVTPNPAAVAVGATLQMKAVGTFNDGSTSDVTSLVKWEVSTLGARVDFTGVVTGVSAATGQVMASLAGRQGTVALTVS